MRRRFAILSLFVLLWAAPAFSQGCAMCRSSAEATSKDGRKAISEGVVILLVPPLGIMTVGVWMAIRYGKKRDIEQSLPVKDQFDGDRSGSFEDPMGHQWHIATHVEDVAPDEMHMRAAGSGPRLEG